MWAFGIFIYSCLSFSLFLFFSSTYPWLGVPCPSPSVLSVCLGAAAVCSSVGSHAGISGVQAQRRDPVQPGSRDTLAYQWPKREVQEQPTTQGQGMTWVLLWYTLLLGMPPCFAALCTSASCAQGKCVCVLAKKKKKKISSFSSITWLIVTHWHVCGWPLLGGRWSSQENI